MEKPVGQEALHGKTLNMAEVELHNFIFLEMMREEFTPVGTWTLK